VRLGSPSNLCVRKCTSLSARQGSPSFRDCAVHRKQMIGRQNATYRNVEELSANQREDNTHMSYLITLIQLTYLYSSLILNHRRYQYEVGAVKDVPNPDPDNSKCACMCCMRRTTKCRRMNVNFLCAIAHTVRVWCWLILVSTGITRVVRNSCTRHPDQELRDIPYQHYLSVALGIEHG
jgi:hypothetical protein